MIRSAARIFSRAITGSLRRSPYRDFSDRKDLGRVQGCAWSFEPLNTGDGTLVVRKQAPCKDVATFDLNASSGRGLLQICDGRTFVFRSDFWKGSAEFQTMAGEPVVQFRFRGVIRRSAEVEFRAAVDLTSDRIWLAMLGWCIILGYL